MSTATLLLLGVLVSAGWLVSLWRWPFAPCRACSGKGTNSGSSRKRFGLCRKCGGTRRRERLGARYVNRAVRAAWNRRKK
jgi:hypothetical protein